MENFDQLELEKFTKLADQWWDPNGKFKPLHLINPLRTSYIEDKVDINNLEILDIGSVSYTHLTLPTSDLV